VITAIPLLAVAVLSLLSRAGADLRVSSLLVVLSLVSLASHLARSRGPESGRDLRRLLAFWATVYAAVGLLSLLWSVHPQAGVAEFQEVLLGVCLLALAAYGADMSQARLLWTGVAVIGFLTCLGGLLSYVITPNGHLPVARIAGTLTYANVFAIYSAAILVLIVCWQGPPQVARHSPLRWLWLLIGGVAAAGFIGALSRGALMALLPALALVLWWSRPADRGLRIRRLAVAGLTGLLILVGFIALKPAVTGQPLNIETLLGGWHERFHPGESGGPGGRPSSAPEPSPEPSGSSGQGTAGGAGEQPDAGDDLPAGEAGDGAIGDTGGLISQLSAGPGGRLSFWASALAIAADYPLTGTGLGTFPRMHLTYQQHPRYYATEAHSVYLQTLAETGIIGLLTWLGIVGSGFWVLVRALRASRRFPSPEGDSMGLVSALGGVFVLLVLHSAIDLDMSVPAVQALFWLTLGSLAVYAGQGETAAIQGATSSGRASSTYHETPRAYRKGPRHARVASGNAAGTPGRPALVLAVLLLVALMASLPALSLALSRSGYELVSSGYWDRGLSRLARAERLNPLDPAPHALLASIAYQVAAVAGSDGATAEIEAIGLRELDAAIALDPRNPNLWTQKAQFLHVRGELDRAIEAMEQAASLAPYFPDYHYRLAVLYAERGADEKALAEVEYVLSWWNSFLLNPFAREDAADLEDDLYLLAAATSYRTGRLDEARTYLEKVLALNPKNDKALDLAELLNQAQAPD